MLLIEENIPLLAEYFAKYSSIATFSGRELTRAMVLDSNANALFVRSTTNVNADLLHGTNVRFVGTSTAGIDHVDVQWLLDHGIRFAHAPGCNAWSVAEYVVSWISTLNYTPPCTVGIVGHGNVGSRLDSALRHLGYSTLMYDPPLYGHVPSHLEHLLHTTDVVTLHVPLVTEGLHATRRMIGMSELAMMKQGSLLIQASRGDVVDEMALLSHVRSQHIRAVLDVFSHEPAINSEVVEALRYCTPHIAGASINAKLDGARMIAEAYTGSSIQELRSAVRQHLTDAHPATTLRDVVEEARWFTDGFLEHPAAATFDALRKAYKSKAEVLRTLVLGDEGY